MERIAVTVTLLCGLSTAVVGGSNQPSIDQPFQMFHSEYFKAGDPRLCMEIDRVTNFPVQRFEVLPGIGWDNLQNVAKGQVIDYNYTKCLTTDDGRYLVPDQVFTIPIKESFVDTFAELVDTWHNTSSTTSTSVNANAGLQFSFCSISGSYSHEHTQIKKKQIEDKAVTVRVQLRYHRYKSQLQPDSPLHKTFKRRLLNIAAFLQMNQTQMAVYEGQLLVRDFGTHYLTSVTAGAGLMKTDFLTREYVASQSEDKTKVLASASASFGSFFHAGGSYGHSTETDDYKSYLRSMTHSFVTSHGGPLMKAFNMSANDWTKGVDMELVPMDRSGDPLSFLVTQQTLPELTLDLVFKVEKVVRKSIMQYYEMNTIFGCTKLGAPNFRFSANFDDGSCEAIASNMTFGGIFQTCKPAGEFLNNNPCTGLSQVNPKTRDYSCQSPYTQVKLVTGHKVGAPEYKRECHSCGFLGLFSCCDTRTFVSTAVYTVYWCAGLGLVPDNSGYLFGGLYSKTQENPITGTNGCPPSYYPRIFLDQNVCISDDFEVGAQYSVPFGGFMSCTMGNPLSMPGVKPVGKGLEKTVLKSNSLMMFMAENNDPSLWPKHCPKGYSQHLVSIDNGCEVRYCLKSGSLSGPNLPKVKLPPYQENPNLVGQFDSRVMFNRMNKKWINNEEEYNKNFGGQSDGSWQSLWSKNEDGSQGEGSGMSPGVAAVIAIIVTLCCGVLALAAFRVVQRRRHARTRTLNDDCTRPLLEGVAAGSFEQETNGTNANNSQPSYQQGTSTCAVNIAN